MSGVKYAAFTMDVEAFSDTICVSGCPAALGDDMLDGVERYADMLCRHGIRGTFFTVPSAARKIPALLGRCIGNGHEIALHGGLTHKIMSGMSAQAFAREVREGRNELERLLGVRINGFRAPCFSIDGEQRRLLAAEGFVYDSSLRAGADAGSPLNGVSFLDGMCEFPSCCVRRWGMDYPVSGGGFLRIPPRGTAFRMVKKYISQSDYYLFYIHPFEAAGRPHPETEGLNWRDRVYMRRNLTGYLGDAERIILLLKRSGFVFTTLSELADKIKTP